jgi:hypothetical protein
MCASATLAAAHHLQQAELAFACIDRHTLQAGVALGLLEGRRADGYRLSNISATYLTSDSPESLAGYVRHSGASLQSLLLLLLLLLGCCHCHCHCHPPLPPALPPATAAWQVSWCTGYGQSWASVSSLAAMRGDLHSAVTLKTSTLPCTVTRHLCCAF